MFAVDCLGNAPPVKEFLFFLIFNVNNNKIIGNIPNTGIYVYNFDGDVNSSPNYLVNNVISGTVVGSGTPTGISLSGYYFYSATNPDTTDYICVHYYNRLN